MFLLYQPWLRGKPKQLPWHPCHRVLPQNAWVFALIEPLARCRRILACLVQVSQMLTFMILQNSQGTSPVS